MKHEPLLPTIFAAVLLVLAGCSIAPPSAAVETSPQPASVGPAIAADLLPDGKASLPGLATGGEPSQAQLEAIAANGFRTIVNLRTEDERSEIQRSDVKGLGMRYVSIPVAGADGLDAANVDALDRVLDDPDAYPVVLFCSSGNRVGALLALRAAWLEDASPEEALTLGKNAGLTRLEPVVRQKLGLDEE